MVVSVIVLSRCVPFRLTFSSHSAVDALKLKSRLHALHEGRFLYLLLRHRTHYGVLNRLYTLLLHAFEALSLEVVPEVNFGIVRSEFFLSISYCSVEAIAVMLHSMFNTSYALRPQACSGAVTEREYLPCWPSIPVDVGNCRSLSQLASDLMWSL